MAQQAVSERQKILELYGRASNYERYDEKARFDETQKVSSGATAVEGRHAGLTDFLMEDIDRQALRGLHGDAKKDGLVDKNEGEALRELNHEMRLDTLSSAQALHHMGFDVQKVAGLDAKLVSVDSAASKPDACHQDQDGQPLVNPSDQGGLSAEESSLWVDKHAALFDLIHGPKKTPQYGDKPPIDLPGTPMRKLVSEDDAAGKASGLGLWNGSVGHATVGGFVARQGETARQSGEQACATTGLDSTFHENVGMFDRDTSRFTGAIRNDGATSIDYAATDKVAGGVQVPLGQDAEALMRKEAERRRASSTEEGVPEYVPELLRGENGAQLPRVNVQNRETMKDGAPMDRPHTNPYTGWGNASTRRARDAEGNPFKASVTQELVSPHVQLPHGAQINRLTPTGEVRNLANAAGSGADQRVEPTSAEPRFDEKRGAFLNRLQSVGGGTTAR